MGKAEGGGEKWHGHVTALTVAPEFRRLGLAGKLMNNLEQISEQYVSYDRFFYTTFLLIQTNIYWVYMFYNWMSELWEPKLSSFLLTNQIS